jgi:hypothetical protein
MSGISGGVESGPRDRVAFAIILIVVGVASLATQLLQPTTDVGGWIVTIIGLGLLGAFALTRQYGYLIPGGIMTGLGAGIVASEALTFATDESASGPIVLGLGLGFVGIWVIGSIVRVAQNHWWPVIPGGILVVVGGALLVGGQAVDLLDYWGVVIIAVGLLVLWRAWSEGRAHA